MEAGAFIGMVLSVMVVITVFVIASNVSAIRQTIQSVLYPAGSAQVARVCPHCRLQIHAEATVCAFCTRESEPWRLEDGVWWRPAEGGGDEYFDPATRTWSRPSA